MKNKEHLVDLIVESIPEMSTEEIKQECKEVFGDEFDSKLSLLKSTSIDVIRTHKKSRLKGAKERREKKIADLQSKSFEIPKSFEDKINLLMAIKAQNPGLTTSFREFQKMSEDELDEILRDFLKLGLKPEDAE